MHNQSLALAPLTPVTVSVTRHVAWCDCPTCPQVWTHRPNTGAPIVETVHVRQYVRPGAGAALTRRVLGQ